MLTCRALVSLARRLVAWSYMLPILLWVGCSGQDAVLLSISAPPGALLGRYSVVVQDRDTRQILYRSGAQSVDPANPAPRDLSATPLRLGIKLDHPGTYLFLLRATQKDPLIDGLNTIAHDPELFFASIATVSGTAEIDAALLPVAAAYDRDGDHFPDGTTWLASSSAAADRYGGHPELLDCVDAEGGAATLPTGISPADINPLSAERCGLSFDVTCAGKPSVCIDADGDGDPQGSDCDDHDPRRFHGNPRPRNCCVCADRASCQQNHAQIANLSLCQPARCGPPVGPKSPPNNDYDCTGRTVDCFRDDDCDGFSPDDPVPSQRDCDDHDAAVHPGAAKNCADSSKDWACDGNPRGGCVSCDLDGDGYQRLDAQNGCPDAKTDIHAGQIDCDDNDRGVFPGSSQADGATQVVHDLNGKAGGSVAGALRGLCRNTSPAGAPQDTDCNAAPRNGCPSAACDADGDGFPNTDANGCNPSKLPLDCNDHDPHIFPGAPDLCGDKIAQNCVADTACDRDHDKDGYNADVDCDDNDPAVHPWALERCNGRDDDCDGLIDELNPDPIGTRLVQSHVFNGTTVTSTTSCTDSNMGDCKQLVAATGGFTGRCVCSGLVPTVTRDKGGDFTICPQATGTKDTDVAPRCFGAYQPYQHQQTCDAANPHDEDCDGRTDAPDGLRLFEYNSQCGVDVGQCKSSKVVGCDRSKPSLFFAPKLALGFVAKNRFLVCDAAAVTPVAEICNGLDDDCNGQLPGQGLVVLPTGDEADHDGDGYLACTGVPADPTQRGPKVKGGDDCNDLDDKVHPGAAELCDGKDNACTGAGFKDGKDDCKDVTLNTCCAGPPQCIDPLTQFKHCGTCANVCTTKTATQCKGGSCLCENQAACSGAQPVCKAGTGCVQCLGDADCPMAAKKCNPMNACVQCLADADCGPGTPLCKGGTCVQCKGDSDCGAGKYCTANTCQSCAIPDHCGTVTCNVCTGSAEPACMAQTCACASDTQCNTGDTCTAGVCVHPCAGGLDCTAASQGTACVVDHCGCVVAADCASVPGTACVNTLCTCGGTVCKNAQTCTALVCK